MEYCLGQMYGDGGGRMFFLVKSSMFELFEDYKALYCNSVEAGSENQSQANSDATHLVKSTVVPSTSKPKSVLKAKYKQHKMETGLSSSKQYELEMYLNEAIVDEDGLDVLRWWKLNCERFPILARMAKDVLAFPISTVASESAFSTRGRVLDPFRSSLTPRIVEALICTQDWMRSSNNPISVEEAINDVENLKHGMFLSFLYLSSFISI